MTQDMSSTRVDQPCIAWQVNGIKLASEVGKASKWCHLPVIGGGASQACSATSHVLAASDTCRPAVMSGEASEGAVREAFAAGVADYLVKPIRRNEALTLWQHVWRGMQALAGAQSAPFHLLKAS